MSLLLLILPNGGNGGPTTRLSSETACAEPISRTFRIIKVIQRKKPGFTQGLLYLNDKLIESTGNIFSSGVPGKSVIQQIDTQTGDSSILAETPSNAFGEGLAYFKEHFYQLTYKEGWIHKYTQSPFQWVNQTRLPAQEGWGLTSNETHLISTDGSDHLYFLDPNTLKLQRSIKVKDDTEKSYLYLNELEFIKGTIFANIFQSDLVIGIDPQTGCVQVTLDMSPLRELLSSDERELISSKKDYVLNGIAYASKKDHLFLTGKMWPKIFEIQLTH
jgi:glutamine cyclotransferase